jgi:NADPH:quinone reductase-like Zn-dependent oxidoreductase
MSPQNQAAWLPAKGETLKIGPAESYSPGPSEILIQNKAIAINPVDWKQQASGIFIASFPTILGCDTSGVVVEVGSSVTAFQKGDRIVAHCIGIKTQKDANEAFQKYSVVPAELTSLIPESMSFPDAAVIPLGLSTAGAGLYEKGNLGLPLPTARPKSTGKTLLIWGGSSSVGSSAIQLAVASGLRVITTASKHNFSYCEKLGASKVFDYSSASIVGDIVAELQNGDFAGAYDAIGTSTLQVVDIVAQVGGGHIATALAPPDASATPSTVKVTRIFGIPMGNGNTVGQEIYGSFLPQALKSGQFKPMPPAKVVGEGLGAIQGAMDQLKAGVSASKLVVTL